MEAGDGIIFNRVFKALLVAGKGDKIRLPASSFEQLSSQSAIDKGPMFFEVSAVHHGSRPSTSSSAASHLEQVIIIIIIIEITMCINLFFWCHIISCYHIFIVGL